MDHYMWAIALSRLSAILLNGGQTGNEAEVGY